MWFEKTGVHMAAQARINSVLLQSCHPVNVSIPKCEWKSFRSTYTVQGRGQSILIKRH